MTEPSFRDEIAALPLLAQVAFAARCARRAQSWFNCWCDSSPKDRKVVEAAIRSAEDFAKAKRRRRSTLDVAVAIRRIMKVTIDHARTSTDETSRLAAVRAAHAIIAANAARGAAAYAHASYRNLTSDEAFAAAEAAIAAARDSSSTSSVSPHGQAIRRDLDRLTRRARDEGWTDDSPVPRRFFRPISPSPNRSR